MALSPTTVQCQPLQEGTVVLDIEHDRLLKLNRVGKEIWALLSKGYSPQEIVLTLSEKYQVTEKRVSKDVETFLTRLEALGVPPQAVALPERPNQDLHAHHPWYGHIREPEQKGKTKAFTFIAFVGLFLFDVILMLSSIRILCAWIKAWPTRSRSFTDTTIGEICVAVQNACVWYPRKAPCLQRSAVTTCLLRFRGVPAQMIIGIREMPFLAHAWVEVDGSVVNDWPKVQTFYKSASAH